MKHFPYLIIVLIALGAVFGVDFVLYFAYVSLGILLVGRLMSSQLLKNISAERELTPNAFLSERVQVEIKLTNSSWFPAPWVQMRESVPFQLRVGTPPNVVVTLGSKSDLTIRYEVKGTRRGYYKLGPLRLEIGDVFGFSKAGLYFSPAFLTVYPRIIPLERLKLNSRLPFGVIASRQRLYEDPARPIGVRQYRSGDSLRQINWKVSGRYAHSSTGGLMVNSLEPAISLETFIVLNLRADDFGRISRQSSSEWGIEIVASLAAHLTEKRQAVGFVSNGFDPLTDAAEFDKRSGRLIRPKATSGASPLAPAQFSAIRPQTGRPHLMKILERLARIETNQVDEFSSWLPRAVLGLNWGTTIIIVSPSVDDAVFSSCHQMVRNGFNPVVLLTEFVTDFGRIRERARFLGFSIQRVEDENHLGLEE